MTSTDGVGVRGHVDVASRHMIQGWAVNLQDPTEPVSVSIEQDGKFIATVSPCRSGRHLVRALGLERVRNAETLPFVWRLPSPFATGVLPDRPFRVFFTDSGLDVSNGANKRIPRFNDTLMQVAEDLAKETFFYASGRIAEDKLFVRIALSNYPVKTNQVRLSINGNVKMFEAREDRAVKFHRPERRWFLPEHQLSLEIEFALNQAHQLENSILIELPADEVSWHAGLRNRVMIPRDLAITQVSIPDEQNISRVSGGGSQLTYLIGGATTFHQLDLIAQKWDGRSVKQYQKVVDWGSGCARVVRYFSEEMTEGAGSAIQDIVGLDVDSINVDWCKSHVPEFAEFHHIDFHPPTPLESNSVDFLYGISVMTHLTEAAQLSWLAEICRVMKQDALVVLSANCEYGLFENWTERAADAVDLFGFFDAMPDTAIGDDNVEHYRVTVQSTAHILKTWIKYFDIIEIIYGANAWRQEFVVMRKR